MVATTIKNANVALIFSFLHRIVEVSCMLHSVIMLPEAVNWIYQCLAVEYTDKSVSSMALDVLASYPGCFN